MVDVDREEIVRQGHFVINFDIEIVSLSLAKYKGWIPTKLNLVQQLLFTFLFSETLRVVACNKFGFHELSQAPSNDGM